MSAKAYDIYFPTEPDLSKIWRFVKNLIKNYISENLIKKYIDILQSSNILKEYRKIASRILIAPLRGADGI